MTDISKKVAEYRRIVEHEDNLINHRTSWLLIAQSFLLGACIAKGVYPKEIAIFGIVTTFFTYLSILAAIKVLKDIKRTVNDDEEMKNYKPAVVSKGGIFFFGEFSAHILPISFIIIWVYNLC